MRHASGPAAGQLKGRALRLGEGVSGWVAANRQVMINSEASLDLGEQAFSGSPLKYALSVPLITRESLVGTITLYAETTFTESQSRLVQVIAPHLAQAIWTAKRAEGAAHTSHAQGGARPARPIPTCVSSRRAETFAFRPRSRANIAVDFFHRHFSTFRSFLREFSRSSLGVYLALRFFDRAPCGTLLRSASRRGTRGEIMRIESWVGVTAVLLLVFGGVDQPPTQSAGVPAPREHPAPARYRACDPRHLRRSPSFRAQCAADRRGGQPARHCADRSVNPGPLPGVHHRVKRQGQKIRAEVHLPPSSRPRGAACARVRARARAD